MQLVGSSSLTKDRTWAPYMESGESNSWDPPGKSQDSAPLRSFTSRPCGRKTRQGLRETVSRFEGKWEKLTPDRLRYSQYSWSGWFLWETGCWSRELWEHYLTFFCLGLSSVKWGGKCVLRGHYPPEGSASGKSSVSERFCDSIWNLPHWSNWVSIRIETGYWVQVVYLEKVERLKQGRRIVSKEWTALWVTGLISTRNSLWTPC